MNITIPIPRTAAELVVGDRIAAKFLPTGESADVVFTLNYASYDKFWTFVAFQFPDGVVEADSFLSNASIPLESLAYTVRDVEPEQVEAAPGVDATAVGRPAGRAVARPEPNRCAVADPHGPHRAEFSPVLEIEPFDCPGVDADVPEGRVIGRAPVDEPGLIVGDTADEQRDNAYVAYERDEAEYLPTCPECMGRHHTVEPCR